MCKNVIDFYRGRYHIRDSRRNSYCPRNTPALPQPGRSIPVQASLSRVGQHRPGQGRNKPGPERSRVVAPRTLLALVRNRAAARDMLLAPECNKQGLGDTLGR